MKPRTSRESIKEFSERSIERTEEAKLINPIVYLPRKLRGHQARLTIDNLRVTKDPETIAENHVRIADADPVGFLIAAMQGQPLPSFNIADDGSITVSYEVYPVKDRIELAKWLGQKVTWSVGGKDPTQKREARDAYNAMIKNKVGDA